MKQTTTLLSILFAVGVFLPFFTLGISIDQAMASVSTPLPATPPTPPDPNDPPLIRTRRLPLAKKGQPYLATIVGVDSDYGDQLKMKISNLPDGLFLGGCQRFDVDTKEYIVCNVKGVPLEAGTFFVKVSLGDNHGGRTSGKLKLVVEI